MKAYLFILLCLFVSMYSQNCTEVEEVTDENSCFFKGVTNESYTCCYVVVGGVKKCVEADYERFENETTKQQAILDALGDSSTSQLDSYDCDSNHRDPSVVINQKNYLYVGLLTFLSLLF